MIQKDLLKALMSCRSKRLCHRINQLLKLMNFFGRDLRIQQAVDQSYYIQKQQELETLEEKLSESLEKALSYMNKLEHCYSHASTRWKIASAAATPIARPRFPPPDSYRDPKPVKACCRPSPL